MAYSSNIGLVQRRNLGNRNVYNIPGGEVSIPKGFDNQAATQRLRERTAGQEQTMRENIRGDMDYQDFVLSERQNLAEKVNHYQRLRARGADAYYDDEGQLKTINDLGNEIIQRKTFLDDFDAKTQRLRQLQDQRAEHEAKERQEMIKKPYGETQEGYREGLGSVERQEAIKSLGKSGNKGQISALQSEYDSNLDLIEKYRTGEQNLDGSPMVSPAEAAVATRRNKEIMSQIQGLESPGYMGGLQRTPQMPSEGRRYTRQPQPEAKTTQPKKQPTRKEASKGTQFQKIVNMNAEILKKGKDLSAFPAVQKLVNTFLQQNPGLKENYERSLQTATGKDSGGYKKATVGEAMGQLGKQAGAFGKEMAEGRQADTNRQANREAIAQMAKGIAQEFMSGPDVDRATKVMEAYSVQAQDSSENVPDFKDFYNAMKKAGVYSAKAVSDAYNYWKEKELPYLIKEK